MELETEQTLEQFIFEIIDELEIAEENIEYEREGSREQIAAAIKEYYNQMRRKALRLLEQRKEG